MEIYIPAAVFWMAMGVGMTLAVIALLILVGIRRL